MPNARVVDTAIAVPGNITVEDIMAILQANNAANAATAANKTWQPPAGSDPHQAAFEGAPDWVPGAQYWKPGTKPQHIP
jgi:hypothetical protein